MDIKTYEIKIKGYTPLLYNRMKKEFEEEKRVLKKDQLSEWEEKNWRRKAEYDKNENLIFPWEWLKGALIDACIKTQLNPWYATSKKQTYTHYVTAFIFEATGLSKSLSDLEYDGKYVGSQGKRSGGKVWRVRPRLTDWEVIIKIKDIYGRMKIEELEFLLHYAGNIIGVGDNRINGYGRFSVEEIKEVNDG